MENKLEDLDLTTFTKLFDIVIEFAVAYGFQILGAIVVLLIGLKVASWCARKTSSSPSFVIPGISVQPNTCS